MNVPSFATKKAKQKWARRELGLREDAPACWPKLDAEYSDDYAHEAMNTLKSKGFVATTTDQFGDRWNHFTGLCVWYAPAKYAQKEAA